MSLANFCLSLSKRKEGVLQPKTRTGTRIWRYGQRILIDVAVNPEDRPDWFIEYDRIIRRCYGAGGAGGVLAPEWHKASVFRDWWEANQDPTTNHVITWNIRGVPADTFEFSPATGYFFPEEVKKFFMPRVVRAGELGWSGMLGVGRRLHMNNSYSAKGAVFGGRPTTSYHATELEAHLTWVRTKARELDGLIARENRPLGRQILEARLERILSMVANQEEIKFL